MVSIKKIDNKPLPKKEVFEGSTIGEEDIGEDEHIEYICSQCHTNTIITLTDGAGNHSRYCKRCSATFDMDDNTVRHKVRFDTPQKVEPAISFVNINYSKDVEIRHTVPVRGGFAELQKKGLKITDYHTTEKK